MVFRDNGCLPPGVYDMSWSDFYSQFSFSPKRKILLDGLKNAIQKLKACGCTKIYIDGSFVTSKLEPNDFDACWDGDYTTVIDNMKKIEPVFLEFDNFRENQKDKYKGEFFPARQRADSKGTLYLDFLQQIRYSSAKKGIVVITL